MSEITFILIIVYLIPVLSIIFVVSMYNAFATQDCKEVIPPKQYGAVAIFWPVYFIFNLPKWIWKFFKFVSESTKYFVKDLFKNRR